MIEYKMGKDQAPSEFRFVVYFNTYTDMQMELMEDDHIDIIVKNNLLWAYVDMPWEIDGFVMPKYLDNL
jgi:hypothetical protein|tara:strand:+ start:689 stop:895 length:207 start_codon:yes stop_codon:yes gene_type:complete